MSLRSFNMEYTASKRYEINDSTIYIKVKPLTHRWIKGFETAKEAIIYSPNKCMGHFMGAALFCGNRLLATGNNFTGKSQPGNTVKKEDGTEYTISCHAEQNTLCAIKHYDYTNSKLIMYVARVNNVGKFVNSRPCKMCIDSLRKHGIKLVRFINKDGIPEELKIL